MSLTTLSHARSRSLTLCHYSFTATEQTSGMDKSIRDYQAESVPLRRFAEPHEQGDPALFLISPSASYITGTILRPDGGFSAY